MIIGYLTISSSTYQTIFILSFAYALAVMINIVNDLENALFERTYKTASTLLITVVRYFKRLLRKNKTLGYINIQSISIRKEFYTQQQL